MSFTSSFAHLDGIEFRISDSFQVPPVSELPQDFEIRDPTALLLESEYDFSKERRALAWIEAKNISERKMAEQEEQRRQMSLKRRSEAQLKKEMLENQQRELLHKQREIFLEQRRRQQQGKMENGVLASNSQGTSPRISPTSDSSDEPPPVPPKNPFSQISSTTILTPQPVAENNQDPHAPGIPTSLAQLRSNPSQPTNSTQIWDDFEEKELDPFSNVELKTIDVFKELKTVLQNATIGQGNEVNSSSNNNEVPTDKVTDSNIYENVEEMMEKTDSDENLPENDTQPKTESLGVSINPFLVNVAEISAELKEKSDNSSESETSSRGYSPNSSIYENVKSVMHDNEVKVQPATPNVPNLESPTNRKGKHEIYENVKALMQDNEVEGQIATPGARKPDSPKFNGKIDLYENIKIVEIANNQVKFEKSSENNDIGTNSSAIYDFAKDTPEKASPTNADALKIKFENLMKKETILEKPKEDVSPLYSTVRPRTRAQKSPDQKNPVISSPNRSKLDQTGTSPGFSSPNRSILDQTGTKVLPISFGVAPTSLSTTVLPPIITNSIISRNDYENILPPSISDPHLSQKPKVPPRRAPAIPPREPILGAQRTSGSNLTQVDPTPNLNPFSSSINPRTTVGVTPGSTHHYPPYSIPVSNPSPVNGVAFGYPKPTTTSHLPRKISPQGVKTDLNPLRPSKADMTFIKKTQEEKARFEETMNKALSSLPKNPAMKPVVAHKPTTPPSHRSTKTQHVEQKSLSAFTPLPSTTRSMPEPSRRSPSPKSLQLQALSSTEREFVESIISMGFDVAATIRAMGKCGKDAKEVVDHLCNVQRIADQGNFPIKKVQDAMEVYKEDDKQILDFLRHSSQLLDMGFNEEDVKKALINNDNDQTKALDQLMGQS